MKKELWRLRINWLLILLLDPLYAISQLGLSSSFHQFVTNPSLEEMVNSTQQIEPGLGQTELFYSFSIAAFEFGAMVGALVSGSLIKTIPYWYLWNTALLSHILGYIIYSVASQNWLIIISRLLAGCFLGVYNTLGYSYFASSSETYVEAQRKLGIETNENSAEKVKNFVFSIMNFAYSTGFFIVAGVTVIFAQFQTINQFRAIGWFNVAYGVATLCLFVFFFCGESQFKKCCGSKSKCIPCKQEPSTSYTMGPLTMFIILFLLLFSFLVRVRYVIFQTLFNPIASDSFGFNERSSSYLSLALSVPQFAGAVTLVLFQKLNVSNKAIVIFGLLTTLSGYLLMTDFQAIPYDPCTEYSPFHHPEITKYNKSIRHHVPIYNVHLLDTNLMNQTTFTPLATITSVRFFNRKRFGVTNNGPSIELNLETGNKYICEEVKECLCTYVQPCLSIPIKYGHHNQLRMQLGTFQCSKFCVSLSTGSWDDLSVNETTKTPELAKIETINTLPRDVYFIARNRCIGANVSGHQCHWIPSSTVTKKECEDCQPICRSVSQTLTFTQFCLAFVLIMYSNSLQLTPVIALLTNHVPKQFVGIAIGTMTAINSVTGTVSPLIMDAIYEGAKKRVFMFTISLVILHIPFFIGIIVLYPKLGPSKNLDSEPQYSKLKQEEFELKD